MKYFNITKFFEAEIELAKTILSYRPDDQKQKDRLAHAALKLGKMELAEQYGTSEKLKDLIADEKRRTKL
jgi:hypothetical protein